MLAAVVFAQPFVAFVAPEVARLNASSTSALQSHSASLLEPNSITASSMRPSTNFSELAQRHVRFARERLADRELTPPLGALMLAQGVRPRPFFSPALQDLSQSAKAPDVVAVMDAISRDYVMIGFWYRFAYGIRIFGEMNTIDDRWVKAASAYFDMLANGYIMHQQTLLLYVGTMQAQSFKASDKTTWADAQLGHLTMRQAHFFFMWLYWQNTLDLLTIHESQGNSVDPKWKQSLAQLVAVSNWWAFMHWDITATYSLYQLHFDGKPWDSSKLHAALSYVFQRQFVWLVKSINWAALPWIPDDQAFKAQLKKSVNFHGYALGGVTSAIVFHAFMAVRSPSTGWGKE